MYMNLFLPLSVAYIALFELIGKVKRKDFFFYQFFTRFTHQYSFVCTCTCIFYANIISPIFAALEIICRLYFYFINNMKLSTKIKLFIFGVYDKMLLFRQLIG